MSLMASMGLVPKSDERERKNIDANLLVENPDNFYDTDDVEELKKAIVMAGGVRQNLIVEPIEDSRYRIISGHRRCKAVKELLEEGASIPGTVPCEIETDPVKAQILLITTNSSTRRLTAWERVEQYKQLESLYKYFVETGKVTGKKRDIMAQLLKEGKTNVARLQVISKNLIPDFEQALKKDDIGISVAYEAAKLEPEQQKALLGQHSDGNITLEDVDMINYEVEKQNSDAEKNDLLDDSIAEAAGDVSIEAMQKWLNGLKNKVRPKYYRAWVEEDSRIHQSHRGNEYDYIGACDIDGNKICEGDILKGSGEIFIIVWDESSLGYASVDYPGTYANGSYTEGLAESKIIGNGFSFLVETTGDKSAPD